MNKDLDYYLNLDWTLINGTDLDFNGNPYHYIEIREIPSFVFCAKTKELAHEHYKKQLRLSLMIMLEDGEKIIEPAEFCEDDQSEVHSPLNDEVISDKTDKAIDDDIAISDDTAMQDDINTENNTPFEESQ